MSFRNVIPEHQFVIPERSISQDTRWMVHCELFLCVGYGKLTENPKNCFKNIYSKGTKKLFEIICSGMTL